MFCKPAFELVLGVWSIGTTVLRCLLALFLLSSVSLTQRLPVRQYDDSYGLSHNNISCIHQDKKGYLWIATGEGLNRFDGYGFTNYSEPDRTANDSFNVVTEDRSGNIWVGTNGAGVARLIDLPPDLFAVRTNSDKQPFPKRQKFVNYLLSASQSPNRVNAMVFDQNDTLWAQTDGGIFRGDFDSSGTLRFGMVMEGNTSSSAILIDSHQRAWFGVGSDLIEVTDAQIVRHPLPDAPGDESIRSIVEDPRGRLLVATVSRIFEFVPTTKPSEPRWDTLPIALTPDQTISTSCVDSTGTLWVGTGKGLIKYKDGGQAVYTVANGLSDDSIRHIYEDHDGNIWLGTFRAGLCKLTRQSTITLTGGDELKSVAKFLEDNGGNIYFTTGRAGAWQIIDGQPVLVPGSNSPVFKSVQGRIIQDSRADWWIGTDEGLFRFYGPKLQFKRGQNFCSGRGISEVPICSVSVLYEDKDQKIWVGSPDGNLYCYNRQIAGAPVFERIPYRSDDLDDARNLTSDRSGVLWVGGFTGITRLISGKIVPVDGLPDSMARSLFLDSRGWLWIGLRHKGVSMTAAPSPEHPRFVNYSTENGLANDTVWSITEDHLGRIYFATGQGLDQFDPGTGLIRHITKADGLAGNNVARCMTDRQGNIWVATNGGVSKLSPHIESKRTGPPPIYFSRVQVAGEDIALPETGAIELPEIELPSSKNHLLIEFVGLSFEGEKSLLYQYKLEGADTDWSEPSDRRSLNFASLAPGLYRILVRAINREGVASSGPASFQFRILPPIWQRWWFVVLAALAAAAVAYAVYRYRVGRLVEIERVRTRIAADLHDDLGSSLTQIAMLSEVVRRNPLRNDKQVDEWLSSIANISRDSVQSMSDIVWAVNPRKDRLSHVTQRMRRLASDVLVASDITFEFRAPSPPTDITLGANSRREVFLIFKEALNNLVRHSGCERAEIDVSFDRGCLLLRISDDGSGFDPNIDSVGNGLLSMRERAKNLGGTLNIVSRAGGGTVITLEVPVSHRIRPGINGNRLRGKTKATESSGENAPETADSSTHRR